MIERLILLFQLSNFLMIVMGIYALIKIRGLNRKKAELMTLSKKKKAQANVQAYLGWWDYEVFFWKVMIPLGLLALVVILASYTLAVYLLMTIGGGILLTVLVILIVQRSRNNLKHIDRRV